MVDGLMRLTLFEANNRDSTMEAIEAIVVRLERGVTCTNNVQSNRLCR